MSATQGEERAVKLDKRLAGVFLLALIFGAAGCRITRPPPIATRSAPTSAAAITGDSRGSLISGGRTRTYLLHVPPQYNPPRQMALVLALHGRFGDGKSMVSLTHLNSVADQYGFIVAYPDGYQRSWADGRGASVADKAGVDDVAFLSSLITTLSGEYAIDVQRIYVTGISNGGFMALRLSCDLSNKIAAVAVDAATFPVDLAARCAPSHPMPVLLMNGTADPLVPYAGGVVAGDRGEILSAAATAEKWQTLDGCDSAPALATIPTTANDGTPVNLKTYDGCSRGAQVQFYTIDGGGHTWPGGLQYLPASVVGKTTRNLDASQTAWLFFSQFTLAN